MDNLLLFWDLAWMLLGIGGIAVFWSIWTGWARGRKRCPKCWYDMSHAREDNPLRCPECGYVASKDRHLRGTRLNRRMFAAGSLLVLVALGWLAYPRFQRSGWIAFVPDTALILLISPDLDSRAAELLHRRLAGRVEKFDPDLMWNWQWRLMTTQAARAVQVGDDHWFESDHMALLIGAPAPHDEKALPYLEDAAGRRTSINPVRVFESMHLIAEHGGDSESRRHFIETALDAIPDRPDWPVPANILVWLCQPWPEAEAALPYLIACLGPGHPASARPNRGSVLWNISRMRGHAKPALDAMFKLLEELPYGSRERELFYDAVSAIDHDDPRLRAELLNELSHDWDDGALASLAVRRNSPDYDRVSVQIVALRIWLMHDLGVEEIYPLLERYLYAHDFYFRYFDGHFERLVVMGDEAARLLMHIVEESPLRDGDGGVLDEAHEALRLFRSVPDDVIVRLRKEAESASSKRCDLARETLSELEGR